MIKKFCYICLLCCLSTLYYECSNTKSRDKAEADPEQVALAESILSYFQEEQFDKIVEHFDAKMRLQMNKEQLAVVWAQLNAQVGKYANSEFYGTEKINNVGDKVVYTCYFGSQKLYFQLVLGKENKIIGFFFKPQPN